MDGLSRKENWIDINQCSLTLSCHLILRIGCELYSSDEKLVRKVQNGYSINVTNNTIITLDLYYVGYNKDKY